MATSYSTRQTITTTYGSKRLSGSYLVDTLGKYITDSLGRKIIVLSPNGTIEINKTTYTGRTPI